MVASPTSGVRAAAGRLPLRSPGAPATRRPTWGESPCDFVGNSDVMLTASLVWQTEPGDGPGVHDGPCVALALGPRSAAATCGRPNDRACSPRADGAAGIPGGRREAAGGGVPRPRDAGNGPGPRRVRGACQPHRANPCATPTGAPVVGLTDPHQGATPDRVRPGCGQADTRTAPVRAVTVAPGRPQVRRRHRPPYTRPGPTETSSDGWQTPSVRQTLPLPRHSGRAWRSRDP